MKKRTRNHVKSFFAMLLACLLLIESIPMEQVFAAEKSPAQIAREAELSEEEMIFTGTPADGVNKKALSAMEDGSYTMPWEEEARRRSQEAAAEPSSENSAEHLSEAAEENQAGTSPENGEKNPAGTSPKNGEENLAGTSPENAVERLSEAAEDNPAGDLSQASPEEQAIMPYRGEPTNLTEHVKLTQRDLFINGKKVEDGSHFDVVAGANFSYEFAWLLDDHEQEEHDRPPIMAGDYFEVTLFTLKGLLITDLKDQPAVINSNGRNVRIGTWSLIYHNGSSKDEGNTGECVFRLEFSKYAGAFKEIGGYKKGSGKFDNKGLEDGTVSVGDANGTITIVPPPEQPELPSNPPLPAGVNWNMPKPPEFNNQQYDFGKGIKWADHSGNATPAMEYRGVFVNELQEYQKQLLDVNKDIMADGVIGENETISTDFLKQTSKHNYIIEDTLDVNQEFNAGTLPALNDKYVNQAPFFFEIPILAAGTGNFMNGNVGNENYMLGSDFGNDYIDASKFKQVTKEANNANPNSIAAENPEEYVKANPMTWTIVKVKGADGQRREKLIINIGKFHTDDSKEGLAQSDIKNKKFLNTIDNQITAAKKNIEALQNTSSSPVQQLKEQTDKLESICKKAGVSDENIEKVKQEVEQFNQWFNKHFPNDASKMKDMTVEAATEFAKLNLYAQMESLEADSTLLKDNEYANWKKYYKSLAVNQKFYETNREKYLNNWKDALMRYQMTKAFYETGRIHGFVMKYATRVKNTSTNKFQNNIQISTGGKSYNADVELQITFAHGIVGTFAGGSAVFQKADSGYETLANAGKNGLAGAAFHVFCADFDRETNDWVLHQTQEHLGCFAGKDASFNGNAYVWSHNKANESDEAIEGIVAPEEAIVNVEVDEDGKLALEGLKDSEAHYLVETKAPEGYYLDTTPIRFQTEEGRVIYQMIPNVARAVRLTKESSYDHEAVEGTEFELFDKAGNTPLTGFTKKSIKAPNGKVTQFYWYDQKGKDKLETFANGELNIHGLPEGTYYLQESRAGAGFVLPSNPPKYEFTLAKEITEESKAGLYKDGEFYYALANPSSDGKQPEAVLNDEMTKDVTITKIGRGGAAITGAAFQLLQWTGTEKEWGENPSDNAKWSKVELNQDGSIYFKTNAKKLESTEAGEEAKEGYEVDDKGQLTFTDIPKGHYALLETKAPDDYELALNRWYFDVDITNENPVQVSWNPNGGNPLTDNQIPNEFKNGTLKLQKLVSGKGGNLEEEFRFEIALKDRNDKNYEGWINYTFSTPKEDGSDSEQVVTQRIYLDKESNGEIKVPLKSGQVLTITGLSGGTSYTVTELTPDEYNLVIQNASGVVANDATVTVTARNRYKSGMLRLSKNVSGLNAEKDREFKFELMFADIWGDLLDNKEFSYTLIDQNENSPTKSGKIQVKNGIANVSLKSGQSMTIEGLPDGTMYLVTEEAVDDYQTKVSISNHKVNESGDSEGEASDTTTTEGNSAGQLIEDGYRDDVIFNNVSVPDEGSLMITKAVDCLQVNKDTAFRFKVTLKDRDGNPIAGTYKAVRLDGDTEGAEEEIYFNHEGEVSFTLKHQESLLFKNLPEYAKYAVEEVETPDGYDVSIGGAATGEIRETAEGGEPILVVVTNHHREGNLRISKLVSGRGGDLQKKFKFTLSLKNANDEPLSGQFPYSKVDTVQSDAGKNDEPDSIWGNLFEKFVTFKKKIEKSMRLDKREESESMQLEVDKNGQAEIELKHGEEIRISALPEGTKYKVEEEEDNAYHKTETDAAGTIQNGGTAEARFINTFKVGQLNVKKTVAKGDKNKAFQFKVELSDKNINGSYNEMDFKDGVAEFTLKDGQVKIASQLPAGIKYTVTESGNEGYRVEKKGETGVISETQHQVAEFTNTFKVGQLTVKKTVAKGDTDKAFPFKVELSDKNINGKFGEMEFKNGVADFTLKHGEEKSAEDIPEGIEYTVTESGNAGWHVDKTGDTGIIAEGHHQVAAFTNTQEEGSLKISKFVEGNGADKTQPFIFTISLKDADDKPLQGAYAYTLMQQEGDTMTPVEEGTRKLDASGKMKISLSHGQVETIHNLPAETTYKVEERPDSAYEVTMEGGSGKIEKDKTASVIAQNRYKLGMLRLSKNVSGLNAEKDKAFQFELKFADMWGDLFDNKEFTYTLVDTDGENPVESGKLPVKNGIANVSLKSGQNLTIEGLPDGTWYEIVEEEAEDYQTKISINDAKLDKNGEEAASGTTTIEGNKAGQLIEDGYRDDVIFNNISVPDEGSLMITKAVDCLQVNKDTEFRFKVTLKDRYGVPIAGTYKAVRLDGETEGTEEEISFNEKGELFFTLKHQESLLFTNLPEYAKYEVAEIETPDGYDVSIGGAATGEIRGTEEGGEPILVIVTNHHREGNLRISKFVSGRGADLQKKFQFTLSLKNADGEPLSGKFPYTRTDALQNEEGEDDAELHSKWDVFLEKFLNIKKDAKKDTVSEKAAEKNARAEQTGESDKLQLELDKNGQTVIELKNGEAIRISALPEGTKYEVKETQDSAYDVTMTGADGTIANKITSEASFVNTFKVGALTVKKTVAKGDTTQDFPFQVELTNGTNINGKYGDMEFKNGVAQFTLKHGEEKKATDLPAGITYEVTETSHEGYIVNRTGETGTISDSETQTAEFTNTQEEGSLKISKSVEGRGADLQKKFEFTLSLKNAKGEALSGAFPYTKTDAAKSEAGQEESKNQYLDVEHGQAIIELKHGEEITVSGLPKGTEYKVTETTDSAYTAKAEGAEGTIEKDGVAEADFVNTFKVGALTVKKTVAKGDTDKAFSFQVELIDKSINGTYGEMEFKNGVAKFTLKHGEQKKATDLPAGITYEVTESDNEDYHVKSNGDGGLISDGETKVAEFTNTRKVGALTVKKTVAKGDIDKAFSFQVELSDKNISGTYGEMEFKNGVAQFTLKHGEQKKAADLPTGITYEVTESGNEDYHAVSKDEKGEISDGKTQTAEFTNTLKVGALTVKKIVAKGDTDKAFSFQVELSDKNISGTYGEMKFKDGVAQFTLKHGEEKKATDLPAGITYEVTESDNENYHVVSKDEKGEISDGKTQTAEFTNTRKVGALTVKKTVAKGDTDKAFSFQVELSDKNINGTYGEMEFKDGVAQFTLKHGEEKKATDLPAGITYEVTESGSKGYIVKSTGETGTITDGSDGKMQIAEFTNTQEEGSLRISKLVEGNGADKTQPFIFTISLKDADDKPLQGAYTYTLMQQEGDTMTPVEEGTLKLDASGKMKTSLSHGQVVTIHNLPAETTYKVEERPDSAYEVTMQGGSGKIEKDKTAPVIAQNRYKLGMLRLSKNVSGLNAEKDRAFQFELKFGDVYGDSLGDREFTYTLVDTDGKNPVQSGKLQVKNGIANLSLKSGQNLTIEGIPDGTWYEIVEEEAEDYQTKISINDSKLDKNGVEDASGTTTIEGNKAGQLIEDGYRDDVIFNNISVPDEGSLMITKAVDCLQVNKDTEFQFKMTLKDRDGKPIAGTYKAVRLDGETEGTEEEISFNEKGELSFTLKHQESLLFTNLPEYARYKVEEVETPDGYDVSMGDAKEGEIRETAEGGAPILVMVTNHHREGNLRISKFVSGRGADLQKKFQFTLSLKNADGEPLSGKFPYTRTDALQNEEGEDDAQQNIENDAEQHSKWDVFLEKFLNIKKDSKKNARADKVEESDKLQLELDKNGQTVIELKNGEAIRISALPEGTKYEVKETQDSAYDVRMTGADGTIANKLTSEASFVNTFKVGALTVKKTVAKGDTDKAFSFKVELSDENINGRYGEMEFKNGVAQFTLKHGEEKKATDLPAGIKYEVTESDNEGYDAASAGNKGEISDGETQSAEFTNTRKVGALTVKKTVAKGDTDKAFPFQVELSDKSINGKYGEMEFTDGVAQFTLKHGEEKKATDLPTGIKYEVTESGSKGYIVKSTGETGTIAEGQQVADFTNTQEEGSLKISKLVEGNGGDRNEQFLFTISLQDADKKPLRGSYAYTLMRQEGETMTPVEEGKFTPDASGKIETHLSHGQILTIQNLPAETAYKVEEKADSAYELTMESGSGKIEKDKTASVLAQNRYKLGMLRLSKSVSGPNADMSKSFDFYLKFTDADGKPLAEKTFIYTKISTGEDSWIASDNIILNEKGETTLSLKDGEHLTIQGLPDGTKYTVTETAYDDYVTKVSMDYHKVNEDGEDVGDSSETTTIEGSTANGSIEDNYRDNVLFHNIRVPEEGVLMITKTVDCMQVDKDKEFQFKITLKDKDGKPVSGEYHYKQGISDEESEAIEKSCSFKNGEYSFSLKHQEYVLFTDLPEGAAYKVVEEKSEGYDDSIGSAAEGVIQKVAEGNKPIPVAVTNYHREGNLKISKLVEGRGADSQKKFKFTLSLKNAEGEPLSGQFPYVKIDAPQNEEGEDDAQQHSKWDVFLEKFLKIKKEEKKDARSEKAAEDKKDADSEKVVESKKDVKKNARAEQTEVSESLQLELDENGQAVIELKHGEEMIIGALLEGTKYEVKETSDNAYNVTSTGADGTIENKITSEARFVNTFKVGELTVKKTVAKGDTTQDFPFKVELTNGTNINGKYGEMEFKNGVAQFTLKHGEEKKATDLPAGVTYEVTESDSKGYDVASTGEKDTIADGETKVAEFTNTLQVGALTVKKTVAKGDTDKAFSFQVELSDKNINGTYGEMEFKNGVAQFTLKHGEEKKATDLPAGVTYEVTESDNKGYDVESTENQNAQILNGETQVVEFTNTLQVGALTVKKTVAKGDTDKAFAFQVELSDKNINGTYGEMEFTDGVAKFTLKHGEEKKATDLPAGVTYEVTESDSKGYIVESTGEKDTIADGKTKVAEFTNTQEQGSLEISKLVEGNGGDKNQEFVFTISLQDADKKPLQGSYAYTLMRQEGEEMKLVEEGKFTLDASGTIETHLSHGQILTIQNLPAETAYKVEEKADSAYELTMEAGNGKIEKDETAVVIARNRHRSGMLRLKKNVVGSEKEENASFRFTLHFKDRNNEPLVGTYAYIGGADEGVQPPENGTVTLENGSAVVELKDGQEMTFRGLPAGSSYTITETKEEGYTTTVSTNMCDADGKTGNTVTEDGNVVSGSVQDNFRNDVVFYNVRIPKTGNLMISKFVESSHADEKQEFIFHITLKDKAGTPVSGTFQTETGEIRFGADGKADFRLKHKESLIIKGIPENTQYKVEEETPAGYDVSMGEAAEGEIRETEEGQTPITVLVTNYRREGNLNISKLVEGRGADLQEKFEFTLRLKNAKGEPLSGSYVYAGSSELEGVSAPENGILKLDAEGQAAFVLKHGQSILIGGLPEGTTYQVTEKQNDAYEAKIVDGEGTILNQTNAEAGFVNRFRTGELHVRKTVQEGDKEQPFHFTVRLDNTDVNGIYGDLTFENGVAEFELKHGEEVIAAGLPAGIKYTVEESFYENYLVTKTGDTGTIADKEVSLAEFVNTGKEEVPPNPPTEPEEPEEPTPEPPVTPTPPERPKPTPPAKPEVPAVSETQPTTLKEQKETTDKTKTQPKTGDRTKLWLMLFLMGVSLCVALAVRKKRKKDL